MCRCTSRLSIRTTSCSTDRRRRPRVGTAPDARPAVARGELIRLLDRFLDAVPIAVEELDLELLDARALGLHHRELEAVPGDLVAALWRTAELAEDESRDRVVVLL